MSSIASTTSDNKNFSYNVISRALTIPLNQQMIVYQEVEITDSFELNLLGELVVIE